MTNNENRKVVPFAPGNTRAQWVIIFFIILIVVHFVAIISDYLQIQLVGRVINGYTVTWTEAVANDDRQAFIWVVGLILSVITLIIFLIWIHRVYRNLPSLGADNLMFSPGWTVAGFFIPIWNLIHPFLVMREIWKASDSSIDVNDRLAWKNASLSFFVTLWWLLFLVSWFISTIANHLNIEAMSIEELYTFSWAILAIEGLSLFYAVLTIQLVRNINLRQMEKSKLALNLSDSSTATSLDENEEKKEFMWVCDKCGAEIEESDNFCPKCGDKF